MPQTALKKITPAQIEFDPQSVDWDNQVEPIFVMRVIGLAKSLRPYSAPGGDTAFGLRGQFKAIRPDGKEFSSGVLYPPAYVQELIQGAITDEDDFEGVKIAYDLFCQKSKNKRTGSSPYEYTISSLVDVEATDVMKEIEATLPSLPPLVEAKALPAPAKKTAKK